MSVDFHGEDSERIAETLKVPARGPFGRSEPSGVMPDCPKPLFQAQSRWPSSACDLAIRAGSTGAQSSGTSVGLGAEVSGCFC